MTKDKSIFIKNIYYMLSYAFQILKQSNYDEVASEQFEKVQDLFAAILSKGVAQQLKQGLYREYITKHETLSIMRGKLDMQETIRNRIQRKQKLACEFDELSENNLFNQILKTTLHYLVRDDGVTSDRKAALKKLLVFFDRIDLLDPSGISWSRLHYQRNNRNYELLMNICYFVLDGMLQTTDKGEYKMMAFSDEHMARLYERFILEYYRQHHTYDPLPSNHADRHLPSNEREDSHSRCKILRPDIAAPVRQVHAALRKHLSDIHLREEPGQRQYWERCRYPSVRQNRRGNYAGLHVQYGRQSDWCKDARFKCGFQGYCGAVG